MRVIVSSRAKEHFDFSYLFAVSQIFLLFSSNDWPVIVCEISVQFPFWNDKLVSFSFAHHGANSQSQYSCEWVTKAVAAMCSSQPAKWNWAIKCVLSSQFITACLTLHSDFMNVSHVGKNKSDEIRVAQWRSEKTVSTKLKWLFVVRLVCQSSGAAIELEIFKWKDNTSVIRWNDDWKRK